MGEELCRDVLGPPPTLPAHPPPLLQDPLPHVFSCDVSSSSDGFGVLQMGGRDKVSVPQLPAATGDHVVCPYLELARMLLLEDALFSSAWSSLAFF